MKPQALPILLLLLLTTAACLDTRHTAVVPMPCEDPSVDWGYGASDGPDLWPELSTCFALCGTGAFQSPIELGGATPESSTQEILVDYYPAPVSWTREGLRLSLDFDGNSSLAFGERSYNLQQILVHTPAEHVIDGRPAAAELQFVHRDPEGRSAIIGLLIEEGPDHPTLAELWPSLPSADGSGTGFGTLDISSLIPKQGPTYRYTGSLTTPPCFEGAQWIIYQQPLTVSASNLALLAERFEGNSRPEQPLAGRQVTLVDGGITVLENVQQPQGPAGFGQ